MVNKLYHNPKLEIRKSPIHGYGVFAKEFIRGYETLEECHFIDLGGNLYESELLGRYIWKFPTPVDDNGNEFTWKKCTSILAFGFASIYNSTLDNQSNNVNYDIDWENKLVRYSTNKDVHQYEELLVYYGDEYVEWMKRGFKETEDNENNI